jgi:small subunit ribosomal protein S7e
MSGKGKAPVAAATTTNAKPAAATNAAPAAAAPKKEKKPKAAKPAAAAATNAAAAAPAAKAAKPAKKAAAAKPEQKSFKEAVVAPQSKKISKKGGEQPTDIELAVARALLELEVGTKDLTSDLADLFITSAKEVDCGQGKKSVVVFVPYKQHLKFKKIQARLIRELEKKLGKHVVIIAQRTILSKNYTRIKAGQQRPRSRTLTTVHNAILEDLVYPVLIVGKRARTKLDGSRQVKVHLDPKDTKDVDYKLKSFSAIYKKLTNKNVDFSFPLEN